VGGAVVCAFAPATRLVNRNAARRGKALRINS